MTSVEDRPRWRGVLNACPSERLRAAVGRWRVRCVVVSDVERVLECRLLDEVGGKAPAPPQARVRME